MKTFNLTLLALCSLILFSCRKDAALVKPDVETTLSGQFYDEINTEPSQNVKLKIGEYKRHSTMYGGYNYEFVAYRDSTVTGTDGTYKISFKTSGKGSSYFLEFKGIPENVNVSAKGDKLATKYYRSRLIEDVGGSPTYDFAVYRSYFMKTRVIVHNNPYPILFFAVGNGKKLIGNDNTNVYGANKDTVVNIPIFKNSGGFNLSMSVTDPVTHITYSAPRLLLDPVIDRDTINGGTYELYPATFK